MTYKNGLWYIVITLCIVAAYLFARRNDTSMLAQELTPTATEPPDLRVFPNDLLCDKMQVTGIGPMWNGITIGVSKLSDLHNVLNQREPHSLGFLDDGTFFFYYYDRKINENKGGISGCAKDNTIVALSVLTPFPVTIDVKDFVKTYGYPDTVTWTRTSPNSRVLIWFEKGIAVESSVYQDEAASGGVFRIVYFPYAKVDGYQNRWPYKYTRWATSPFPEESEPERERTQNPYDFTGMASTITAEPRKTLDATLQAILGNTPTLTSHK